MTSKVMGRLESRFPEFVVEGVRREIRAAITEFAEMTELDVLNINESTDDGYTLVRNRDYHQALAAFGVEEK